jgi:hypothetical protein
MITWHYLYIVFEKLIDSSITKHLVFNVYRFSFLASWGRVWITSHNYNCKSEPVIIELKPTEANQVQCN